MDECILPTLLQTRVTLQHCCLHLGGGHQLGVALCTLLACAAGRHEVQPQQNNAV
jgi:hypothetical protein